MAAASRARRPSFVATTTRAPLKGTACGSRNSVFAVGSARAGMWLLLYSPASLTSIKANDVPPFRRASSAAGPIVSAMLILLCRRLLYRAALRGDQNFHGGLSFGHHSHREELT